MVVKAAAPAFVQYEPLATIFCGINNPYLISPDLVYLHILKWRREWDLNPQGLSALPAFQAGSLPGSVIPPNLLILYLLKMAEGGGLDPQALRPDLVSNQSRHACPVHLPLVPQAGFEPATSVL